MKDNGLVDEEDATKDKDISINAREDSAPGVLDTLAEKMSIMIRMNSSLPSMRILLKI